MTVIVENARRRGFAGDLKFIHIQTTAAADTGHTIDLLSDATDGRGSEIQEILNILIQDDAGLDEETTWDPATGIITMGTLTATGIHNIWIIGR